MNNDYKFLDILYILNYIFAVILLSCQINSYVVIMVRSRENEMSHWDLAAKFLQLYFFKILLYFKFLFW